MLRLKKPNYLNVGKEILEVTKMKKTLRLIYTPKCNRSCEGCCNKDFDLPNLPRPDHFNYDEIFITGGEPLLYVDQLIGFIKAIRLVSNAKIYVYTAMVDNLEGLKKIFKITDGLTVTLHEPADQNPFYWFNKYLEKNPSLPRKSLRLNVFKGVNLKNDYPYWKIKKDIEWIKNCPLPKNEVLMKVY